MKKRVNSIKNLFFLFLLITLSYPTMKAQQCLPKLKQAIEIKKLKIKNIDKNKSQLELGIPVAIFKDGSAKLKVHSGKSYINYNGSKYKSKFEKDITLLKEQNIETIFSLETEDKDNILISIYYEFPDAPSGYQKEYARYFKIIKNNDEYLILDPREKTDLKPKEITIIKGSESNSKKNGLNKLTAVTQNYTVNVSGKITVDIREKGLYGNGVALWFRNSSNPGTWYHPVLGHNQYVHYDILDEQGNFNFSFSGDLSGYNELIVIVNTANAATYLPAPVDGYIVWENNGYATYFNESEGILASINGSNSSINVNQNGEVNYEDGSVLRYMMLSRDYAINLYGGNIPFSIDPISSRVTDLDVAGHFVIEWTPSNGYIHYIEIDPLATEFTTVSHEYGHYVNFCMWDRSKFTGANDNLKEGWGIFYSFGTRNYGNKLYSDDLRSWDDNTETAPFTTPTRYTNIRYAYHGEPGKAAAACYLWSLYDNYEGGNFETSSYDIGDNDDISGYSAEVFETMRNLTYTNLLGYHLSIATKLNNEEVNSENDIHQFMFDDLYSIPAHKMKPAQVKNFSGQVISSTQINFTWLSQSYSSNPSYSNSEPGYKLYYKDGSNWNLISTINYGQNSYTYTSSSVIKEYKITSYNSSGESSNSLSFVPLSATMSGPSYLSSGQSGTWMVTASGGTPPYSYSWSYYVYCDILPEMSTEEIDEIVPNAVPCGYWFSTSITTNSFTRTSDGRAFQVKCVVTDANNSTYTVTKTVGGSSSAAMMKQSAIDSSDVALLGKENYTESLDNYPNPFNPTTKISFTIPNSSHVTLRIYDILGREVAVLADKLFSAGRYEFEFDASNLPSGTYIYNLTTENKTITKKMLLIK